ncbi:MAG: enediyne biosynthesis protein [Acidobacteriota bacterium]|nr:enediyne biosynthesis protein [Acidobacteriota bacterium]
MKEQISDFKSGIPNFRFEISPLRTPASSAVKNPLVVAAALLISVCSIFAQQPTPSPTPQRTGRSYGTTDTMKTPPSSGPQAPSPVTFTDITAQTKIDFKQSASLTSQKYLLESMGGGVCVFDYDNDGRLDLFFTNGARLEDPMPKGAMPDKRDPKFWNRLYHQKADGTFEDVTERAGVKGEGYSMGVAAADYDSDGFVDLYVTGYGGNILYHNNGDGTFTDVTKKLGVAGGGWSTSAGWFDYDNDGRLDLFVARYADWDFEKGALYCGDPRPGYRAYCHPDNFKGASNLLFHQKADGTFEDVSVSSKIADPNSKGLGVAFADFDNDGWTDIIVANDSVRQELYHNKGDGTFEDVALMAGVGYNENGKTFAGMGVDAKDYDGDGLPDIFITALSNETYPLYRNNGDGSFNYTTNTTSVGQITLLYSGWGAKFFDADDDGWLDIFVAQSHVLDTIEKTSAYLKYKQTPLLMRNTGKGFVNVSATAGEPFIKPIAARGAAFADLNNDGYTDIVIGVVEGSPVILRNNGTHNHWLGISLVGTKSNRNGLGARITLTDGNGRQQVSEVTSAGSYLSSSDPRVIFGLGTATSVKSIEVRWPGGRMQKILNPSLDRYLIINERDVAEKQNPEVRSLKPE